MPLMSTPVIDFHTHIFPPELRDSRDRYVSRDATFGALYADPKARMASAADLLAAMDADGVDIAVAMGLGWTDYGLAREANDYIIGAARQSGGRIVGFAGVNPAWGKRATREAERCADAGLLGIGELHPDTQGYDLADRRVMAPLMRIAQERRLIVTTHASEPVGHLYPGKGSVTPQTLMRFITAFPAATIVCAHWGGGLPFYALMPEIAAALRNTCFDTAASPFLYDPAIFQTIAGIIGSNKILFGSDYALLRPRRPLRQARASGLPADAQAAILGGNAVRLLGIDKPADAQITGTAR